jgi:beta-fructofuranosidase
MHRYSRICLFGAVVLPLVLRGETASEALVRATAAVEAATPRAQADPARPIFHVAAPAQWINDPNGPIFYRGYYHLFYQLHPFSDESGTKYWGHVRSRDLVTWEHLPIALAPSGDQGEEAIWSGCCTLNGRGEPMILYTSIARGKSAFDHAEQWAATSDDQLVHWQKSAANPVLSEALHGGQKIYDWRDPFAFHDGKRTFLVLGGHLAKNGQAAVNIYEAKDSELTRWEYRGVLFEITDAPTAECPNFFKLRDQWVLFVSPYGKVQYFIGDFNSETCRFTPRKHGLLDCGPNFYAPNTMLVPDGRRLVWGWINGFSAGHGWQGCLSLPRQLGLSRDGELAQAPAPQLTKLRGRPATWRNIRTGATPQSFQLPQTNALEILAEVEFDQAKEIELSFTSAAQDASPVAVSYDGARLKVMKAQAPLVLSADDRTLRLRVFVDRSVLEVVANDKLWFTTTIPILDGRSGLSIRSDGAARLKHLQAWPIKTLWQARP